MLMEISVIMFDTTGRAGRAGLVRRAIMQAAARRVVPTVLAAARRAQPRRFGSAGPAVAVRQWRSGSGGQAAGVR